MTRGSVCVANAFLKVDVIGVFSSSFLFFALLLPSPARRARDSRTGARARIRMHSSIPRVTVTVTLVAYCRLLRFPMSSLRIYAVATTQAWRGIYHV